MYWNPFKKVSEKLPRQLRRVHCFCDLFILAMTVVKVEKIISYNDLTLLNELYQPGQMIQPVLGFLTLINGLEKLCAPIATPILPTHDNENNVETGPLEN